MFYQNSVSISWNYGFECYTIVTELLGTYSFYDFTIFTKLSLVFSLNESRNIYNSGMTRKSFVIYIIVEYRLRSMRKLRAIIMTKNAVTCCMCFNSPKLTEKYLSVSYHHFIQRITCIWRTAPIIIVYYLYF